MLKFIHFVLYNSLMLTSKEINNMANTTVKENTLPPIKIIGFGKPKPIAGHPDYKKGDK